MEGDDMIRTPIRTSTSVPDLKHPSNVFKSNKLISPSDAVSQTEMSHNFQNDKAATDSDSENYFKKSGEDLISTDISLNGSRRLGTIKPPGLSISIQQREGKSKCDKTRNSSTDNMTNTNRPTNDTTESIPSPSRKFTTTPVTHLNSNPFIFKRTAENKPKLSQKDTGDKPVIKKPLVKSPSFPLQPRRGYGKQHSLDFAVEAFNDIRRKNQNKSKIPPSTDTKYESPTRKASAMSMDSAMGSWTTENDRNGQPVWQKKLSQLFIPPSQEELQTCGNSTANLSDVKWSQNSASRTSPGKQHQRKVSPAKVLTRSKHSRPRPCRSCDSSDEREAVTVLEKLIEDDGLSDLESTTSVSSEEVAKTLALRKSETKPLVRDSVAFEDDKKDGADYTSYDDTICSNRSAYFKQYYMGHKPEEGNLAVNKSALRHASVASLIKEKEPAKEKKKKKPDYILMLTTLLLFITICTSISFIYHSYGIYVANVFIFNRIKIVEANRTLEVLSLADNSSQRYPLVKIRLGVGIPIKTEHSECTKYLHYLVAREGEIQRIRKKRSLKGDNNETSIKNDIAPDLGINTNENKNVNFRSSLKSSYWLDEDMDTVYLNPKIRNVKNAGAKLTLETEDDIVGDIEKISYGRGVDICGSTMEGTMEEMDLFSEMQCIYYKKTARMQLTHRPPLQDVDCFSVHWESLVDDHTLKDCFVMDNSETGSWWGVGDVTGGSIPLSKVHQLKGTSLYSGEIQNHVIGGLLRRIWISSKGVLISIPSLSNSMFSIDTNGTTGQFCLSSDKPNLYHKDQKATLDYTVCTGYNVKSLLKSLKEIECMNELEYSTSKWHRSNNPLPNGVKEYKPMPPIDDVIVEEVLSRFNCPVWRPWISHNQGKIDQDDVIAYSESIAVSVRDVCGYVLLPVSWQTKLGILDFDLLRFPDPKKMAESLLRKGLKLALTLSVLVDTNTQQFKDSTTNDLLIKQVNSTLPILVTTGDGNSAGVSDFTNPNTMDWYEKKLQDLVSKYGIDKFHVNPITTLSLPPYRQQHDSYQNPDFALGKFTETVARISTPISTDAIVIPVTPPTFLTARDGDASWEMLEMLPNRILSISSVGGNLVDSGVIGGWSNQAGHIPDRDLFIRWMQVSIFLPAFQISVLPSMYDDKVQQYARIYMDMRKELVIPRFKLHLKESLENGYPFISSFAMMFPDDPRSLSIGDQWMVGEDLMVAPILTRGRKSRDIYLPPGFWKDPLYDRLLRGKRWIRSYPVLLHRVPYFIKIVPETGNKKNSLKRKNGK